MPRADQNRIVETPTQARAGITGQHVRLVLVVSTVAVVVLFVGVYIYFFARG